MKVQLIAHTENPDKIVGAEVELCAQIIQREAAGNMTVKLLADFLGQLVLC